MIVAIDKDSFKNSIHLVTNGCGCCAEYPEATPQAVLAAIKEHQEFIFQLLELLPANMKQGFKLQTWELNPDFETEQPTKFFVAIEKPTEVKVGPPPKL